MQVQVGDQFDYHLNDTVIEIMEVREKEVIVKVIRGDNKDYESRLAIYVLTGLNHWNKRKDKICG